MELIKNRQLKFKIFKYLENISEDGDVVKTYKEVGFLSGSIQPISEKQENREYGIDLNNSYNIYSKAVANVLDRLFLNGRTYEIKVIKKYDSYFIYTVKELENQWVRALNNYFKNW